ncbi:MAG: transposase [Solobacterium sp.]|jgi:hypothetical protein|nr:transposase [Solobacterium sp.]MCH4048880.1 transposase [Solobacterium sp.]MCH4074366.1 transposase [Solobacterium sp.]MCI1313951.1 transposase [Solobacterium sp.]MCI1346050.1 transposase [Solobacterium sp.]
MPKACKKKSSEFVSSPVKSVFLYGKPNKGKLHLLWQMERKYVELINFNIEALMAVPDIHVQLIKNDKKDSCVRQLQKQLRPRDINSAFCQNAFDTAFTKLSNRLDAIRLEMFKTIDSIFCQSKVLFGLCLDGVTKDEMTACLNKVVNAVRNKKDTAFYLDCIAQLQNMSADEFEAQMIELRDLYDMVSVQFRIPHVKSEAIPFDSRLMKIEPSTDTAMPYVITLSSPFVKGNRISIPINTSRHSLHKIQTGRMAAAVTVKPEGTKVRIGWSYAKSLKKPETTVNMGVDTGIKDSFFLSDGRSIGSMKEVIDYYHREVEPAFAQLSSLRNKKRSISHYVRHHKNLPLDVRRSLIQKMDRLEHMIRTANTPYRKKHAYYNMLNHEIKQDVTAYMSCITHDTLTVLELLDIREFEKSHKLNGDLSTFARGKLQQKLMSELNWHGYDYVEVPPDFTSQTCPICSYRNAENRSKVNSKLFKCGCCGYEDDADHVGAVNIRNRAEDKELLKLCKDAKSHKDMQSKLIRLLDGRHLDWQMKQLKTPILQETGNVVSVL